MNQQQEHCPLCDGQNLEYKCHKNNFKVFNCLDCQFGFAWPRPTHEQLHAVYQDYKNNPRYIEKVKKKTWSSKRKLQRLMPLVEGKKLIDIGCSIGCVVEAARQLGFDSYGVDLSEDAIDAARSFFPECQFGSEDTKTLIEKEQKFDLVYSSEVIEHTLNPIEFLQDLKQIANPNGLIYLTTPDIGHYSVPKNWEKWRHLSPPEHISMFTKQSMRYAVEKAGLGLVKYRWSHKSTLKVILRNS